MREQADGSNGFHAVAGRRQARASRIRTTFTDHPASVNETYGEHARFALGVSGQLLVASLAAFVHAVLPFLFETTAGRTIRALHTRIENRH